DATFRTGLGFAHGLAFGLGSRPARHDLAGPGLGAMGARMMRAMRLARRLGIHRARHPRQRRRRYQNSQIAHCPPLFASSGPSATTCGLNASARAWARPISPPDIDGRSRVTAALASSLSLRAAIRYQPSAAA